MTVDRLSQVVRQQIALGSLLPLGGPEDGAWLTESAARGALRRAAEELPRIRLGALRIVPAPDGPGDQEASVPPPPGALRPGPLRIEADFTAPAGEPIPRVAARLRAVLFSGAESGLGLTVEEVDLQVTDLLGETAGDGGREPRGRPGDVPGAGATVPADAATEDAGDDEESQAGEGDEALVGAAVRAVPGVARLTGRLGGFGRAVHIEERYAARGASLPGRHVRVEIAVDRGRQPREVARAVRVAAGGALQDRPTVAVLVTDLI
jgi:hypothetical protein